MSILLPKHLSKIKKYVTKKVLKLLQKKGKIMDSKAGVDLETQTLIMLEGGN